MKKVIVIYDDSIKSEDRIKTIIGNNSFGEIILKRKKIYSYIKECVEEKDYSFIKISNLHELLNINVSNNIILYLKSSEAVTNKKEFNIILDKIKYIKESTSILCDNEFVGIGFYDCDEYQKFILKYIKNFVYDLSEIKNSINSNCFINLENYNNLLLYISSGFDARFFNKLEGDSFYLEKKSKDKKKMKMEYTYYWLLPNEMKNWMVMPYDYVENEDYASYKMERMPMTDIAIRWTHHAIDEEELHNILEKIFKFFQIRKSKIVKKEEYIKINEKLYLTKVKQRLEQLKSWEQFEILNSFIINGTNFSNIDEIYSEYEKLYKKMISKFVKNQSEFKIVIGHGDVFFANMLYSKEINLLRLIDPKGALEEKDLWMDASYDIAKLSHSICGNYDFFNTDMYDITLNKELKFQLNVSFDNKKYINIFKKYLEENNYDYGLIRLYEASLFLSMLPLHIDNPKKVFGFLLNAIEILKEVEKYV